MISLTRLPIITNVKESWSQMEDTIHKAASATPGVTQPGKRFINRDTWLQNEDVEMKVLEKKRLCHKFLHDKTRASCQIYKNAIREAKKAMAVTERIIIKIFTINWTLGMGKEICIDLPKAETNAQDIEHFCTLLTDRRAATDRWREYFEQILSE